MTMTWRRVDYGLTALCGVLAAVFLFQSLAPAGQFDLPPVSAPEPPTLPNVVPFSPPPQATFAAIDARPMFNPARQPVEATAVAGGPSTAAPPDVTLVGVILDNKNQMALVKAEGAPFASGVTVGSAIEGWEVAEITADHVLLRSAAQEFTLRMDAKRKSAPNLPAASVSTQGPPSTGLSAQSGQNAMRPRFGQDAAAPQPTNDPN